MEVLKDFDRLNEENKVGERFDNLKYVEREEDPELKALYEKKKQEFASMPDELDDKVDAHIDIDYHGNMTVRPTKRN